MKAQFISDDVKLGKNVKIYQFVNLYGCEIGDNTKIGTFIEIQKGARIGKNCKISSHTFICEGVTIEDNVFIGHNVTFINDLYPRATNTTGQLQNEEDWVCVPTLVKKGASIGANSTASFTVYSGRGVLRWLEIFVSGVRPDYLTIRIKSGGTTLNSIRGDYFMGILEH